MKDERTMANAIPDLWPDEIAELDVLTPVAILRVQAGQLRQKTRGLVEADVGTMTSLVKVGAEVTVN